MIGLFGSGGTTGDVTNSFYGISQYSSIAALKGDTAPADGTKVVVGGHTANGDGGGGVFYFDEASSATDDGGTIIAPTEGSGRWKRIYSGAVNVRWFGAVGDGEADDTVAIQATIDVGGDIVFPPGTYKHGPVTVDTTANIYHNTGSVVVPVFDADTNEKLYGFAAANSGIYGLTISDVTGTISQNKYLIHADEGADNFTVANCNFASISASDGISGAGNLKVVHGIYITLTSGVKISGCKINGISGAGIFLNTVSNATISNNHVTDTRWYSITADKSVDGCIIENNIVDGTGENIRYYGGSINLMSQTGEGAVEDKKCIVRGNRITGPHNYGSAIRVNSVHGCIVESNMIHDCTIGTLGAGGPVEYISVDRRAAGGGYPAQGPCKDIVISKNILIAGGGSHMGIYIKNSGSDTRDPHENIVVSDNTIRSQSLTSSFETGITVHGFTAGIDGLRISGNMIKPLTISGSVLGGAIGVASTDIGGAIKGLSITGNRIADIKTDTPSIASHVGIYIQQYSPNSRVSGNELSNFYYGLRTAANLVNPSGLNDQVFIDCLTDVLFGTPPAGIASDMSLGTALPVSGVYRVGHIRQKTNAAASASWGWVVTTAGGAMTGAWASGQTYVAGTWYRTGPGRVYELITAGGGTTANSPVGTTIWATEDGGDGYVWRCRATAAARWATLPALGAVEALP